MKRIRPNRQGDVPVPPEKVLGFQPTSCKYCGHRYWEPCSTDAAASKCRNVKLKKRKK